MLKPTFTSYTHPVIHTLMKTQIQRGYIPVDDWCLKEINTATAKKDFVQQSSTTTKTHHLFDHINAYDSA